MKRHLQRKSLGNRGSAMILVLTIISFIAVLGAMSLSTALVNVRMRSINRASDKNFYYLEMALDEIYAQTGRMVSEILKEEYSNILSELFKEDMDTDEEANDRLREAFMKELTKELNVKRSDTAAGKADNCKNAAERLQTYAATFAATPGEAAALTVTIDSVLFEEESSEDKNSEYTGNGLLLKGLCLTYVNHETEMESALTVDLKIEIPYIRFVNGAAPFLDYILVSNGEIRADSVGSLLTVAEVNGNIYGDNIMVDKADVTVNASLMAAAKNLTVRQKGGSLTIGPDKEAGGGSHVWVDGIELDAGAKLTSKENTAFYVLDDMTLINNENQVELKGSYYGYGNEGSHEDGAGKETADKSSAILINDKNSRVDLTGLDTLLLAGRAYLRFNTKTENHSQFIYPMGESLAVKATQFMYLIPAQYITVGAGKKAEHNPIVFPSGMDKLTLEVALPPGVAGDKARTATYEVTHKPEDKASARAIAPLPTDTAPPAYVVTLNGKIYVYYYFSNDRERADYFEAYVKEEGTTFEASLQKSGLTGDALSKNVQETGVYIGDTSRIITSGSLYQVTGEQEEDVPLSFELLDTRQNEMGESLKWVELENQLRASFLNIKKNLAKTMKVKGRKPQGNGEKQLLPMGNYIKMDELSRLQEVVFVEENGSAVYLSKDSVTIHLGEAGATLSSENGPFAKEELTMTAGLIASAGDIIIKGSGSFDGLIMANGKIRINGEKGGKITLNADALTYEPLLNHEEVAPYFYDYSDTTSTVLNQYEDFVIRENWRRMGRGEKGIGDDETE